MMIKIRFKKVGMSQDLRNLKEERKKVDLKIAQEEEKQKRLSINRHVIDKVKQIKQTEREKNQELQRENSLIKVQLLRKDEELKKKDEEIRKIFDQNRELLKRLTTMSLQFKALSEEVTLFSKNL